MSGYSAPSSFYRVSLKALVFDDEQRLLTMRNDDGTWELPGGGWEHDETLEQCMRRELLEELGVEPASIDTTTIRACLGTSDGGNPGLKLAMPVRLASLEFSASAEMHTTRYVTIDEFRELEMHRSDQCLQDDAELLFRR